MWQILRPDAVIALADRQVQKALPRYVRVVEDELPAYFQICKKIKAELKNDMWREHAKLVDEFEKLKNDTDKGIVEISELSDVKPNLLDLKIEIARNILKSCILCERRCKVNRYKELGFCRVGTEMRVCSEFIHYGEEAWITPSHTIFFSRCNWRCVYCQNYDISQGDDYGKVINAGDLAKIIEKRRKYDDVRNVNFVGGEPTPYLPMILEVLRNCNVNIPVVWNSNAYLSKEAMDLLHGVVDVYLFDFRYFNDECAKRLSKVSNCVEILKRNHIIAFNQAELSIRLLVLPNHIDCCAKPILKFISENFGDRVIVNIMDQYYPTFKAFEYKDVNRRLYYEEFAEVVNYAKKLKLNFKT